MLLLDEPAAGFDPADTARLAETLGRIAIDKNIHAVVLTGAGRAFCAGAGRDGLHSTARVAVDAGRPRLIQNSLLRLAKTERRGPNCGAKTPIPVWLRRR